MAREDFEIRIEGIRDVAASLSQVQFEEFLLRSMQSAAKIVRNLVLGRTPVDEGEAKRSWTELQKVEGGYSFHTPLDYPHALEYGSEPGSAPWPGVGPRTVLHQGKIYSRQAPGGMIRPAIAETDIVGIVAREFQAILDRALR